MLNRIIARLAQEDRPVRFLLSRVLWRTGLSRHFIVRRGGEGRGSYRVRFFPSSVSSAAWIYPDSLTPEEALLEQLLRPGDTYVDVGANVGLLALRAASLVSPGGRVIAVEAHPRIGRFLAENVALNGFESVEVEQCACGAEHGTVVFTDRYSDDQNAVDLQADGGLRVPIVPLDELIPAERAPRVHLLKLDVEGFELAVLQGATGLLTRVDRVLFETSARHCARYGYSCSQVYELLGDAGFAIRRLDDSRPVGLGYVPVGTENLLAERPGPGAPREG